MLDMNSLIVDSNNLYMRIFFSVGQADIVTNEDLIKYAYFNQIDIMRSKYHANEVILALDSSNSWRKDIHPKYKDNRRKRKEKDDGINWEMVFATYNSINTDIKDYIPFKVMKLDRCEADDIIGVITLNNSAENIVIVSNDEDFKQLVSDRVRMFSPYHNKFIEGINPEEYLTAACLCGQSKDDIWNVLTPLNYEEGKRKPGFGPKKLEKVLEYGVTKWLKDNKLEERFEINRQLMDFRLIPEQIKVNILKEYSEYKYPHPKKIYQFFKKQEWPEYLERISSVENQLMELHTYF